MGENKAIETGKENNELLQKIVEYLTSRGVDPMHEDFEQLVNLIKGWEESK